MDFNNFLFHYRISELEKSEEKETTQIRRRGRPRKSAASEPLVEEKPQENLKENPQKTPKQKPVVKNEEIDENKQVLKTINDSRKDFLSSLDSSDEKEKNEEENNNKENENSENKENSGPGKKKSSNQWKPVLGIIIKILIFYCTIDILEKVPFVQNYLS